MHPRGLSRSRLFLIRELGHEVVFNPLYCQELGVVEIPDHTVMGKVLEEKSQPSVGVSPDGEGNVLALDRSPELDRE